MGRMAPTVSVVIPLRRGAEVAARDRARGCTPTPPWPRCCRSRTRAPGRTTRASAAASRRPARWCCCSTRTSCPGPVSRRAMPPATRPAPGLVVVGAMPVPAPARARPRGSTPTPTTSGSRDVGGRSGGGAAAAVGRQRLAAPRGRAAGRSRRAGHARPRATRTASSDCGWPRPGWRACSIRRWRPSTATSATWRASAPTAAPRAPGRLALHRLHPELGPVEVPARPARAGPARRVDGADRRRPAGRAARRRPGAAADRDRARRWRRGGPWLSARP